MNHRHTGLWPLLALGLGALGCQPTHAQITEPAASHNGLHSLQAYEDENRLSAGYARWREFGLRGIYQLGDHQLSGEAINMNRFNEDGNYLGLGDTLVLSPDWYSSLNVGAGDGAAYLPKYRLDAFLHRKFLDERRLVGSVGLGRYRAPDGHQDDNASIGLTYHFSLPWVVQAQARRTRSNPGRIDTQQYFVAATWGQHQQTQVTGRYGWGREGYQSLGDALSIAQFASRHKTLTVQHWIGLDWGIKVTVDNYHNPYYDRNGLSLAVFKDFR
jgi:YaiO family outer membrane protein